MAKEVKSEQDWVVEFSIRSETPSAACAWLVKAVREEFRQSIAAAIRRRVAPTRQLGMNSVAHAYESVAAQVEHFGKEQEK